MIDILAQTAEQGGNTAQWIGYLIGATLFAATGGVAGGSILQRRRNRSDRAEEREREVCPIHDQFVQLLEERKQHGDQDIQEVKQSIAEIKTDVKAGFTEVFAKIDGLHAYVRNGKKD